MAQRQSKTYGTKAFNSMEDSGKHYIKLLLLYFVFTAGEGICPPSYEREFEIHVNLVYNEKGYLYVCG